MQVTNVVAEGPVIGAVSIRSAGCLDFIIACRAPAAAPSLYYVEILAIPLTTPSHLFE
jgi:hypothetical protein